MRAFPAFLLILTVLLAVGFPGKTHATSGQTASIQTGTGFDYVVTILMENHPLNTSYPNGIIGNPSLPYINSLARNYSLANYYFAVQSGSLADYIALTDANVTSVSSSCSTPSPSCSTNAVNIIDRVETSGRTWKAYMEDYTGGCTGTGTTYYVDLHNPFVFYSDIQNSTSRCARIVSANPGHQGLPDTQLISDLSSTATASNYMWLTPDNCNNMHGECATTTGDSYLSQLVPAILNSTVFQTQRAALFLVFDEPTYCPYYQCPVPAIWAGPAAKFAYSSNMLYTHYSLLATLENVWSIPPLDSFDGTASAMLEFLNPNQSVGGVIVPIDKLAVIAPFVAFASIIAAAAAGTLCLRHAKQKTRQCK